jgi:hypothetical protein
MSCGTWIVDQNGVTQEWCKSTDPSALPYRSGPGKLVLEQAADHLPLQCTDPHMPGLIGLRLFACACARSIWKHIGNWDCRQAVIDGEEYARGSLPLQQLQASYQAAAMVALNDQNLASRAASACAAYQAETTAPVANRDSLEAGALYAARVACVAARLILIHEKDAVIVDQEQVAMLRRFCPELFYRDNEQKGLIVAG